MIEDRFNGDFNSKNKIFKDSLLVGMGDEPKGPKHPKVIQYSEAEKLNKEGSGIFVTINGFKERRVKECLTSVNAWAIDLDAGSKESQAERINSSPLVPTMIIESKNGYHVWWAAENGTAENYQEIVSERLVPYFGADKNAKDICRLLRMPGFYHMKDPKSPFLVEIKFWNPRMYTEEEMLKFFPAKQKPKPVSMEGKVWAPSKEVDPKEGLIFLSGTQWVNGDVFTFKKNGNGTEQIWVNGGTSPCWIDTNGMIGSLDKGGPTIWAWLHWYYKDHKKVSRIMREVFNA